jgi:hypothetical protein
MVSFSFTMGTTPMESSSDNVFTAFKYRVLYWVQIAFCQSEFKVLKFDRMETLTSAISPLVMRICAMGCPKCPKRLSHSAMSRPCPMAAKAYCTLNRVVYNMKSFVKHLDTSKVLRPRTHIHGLKTHANSARRDDHDFIAHRF